MDELRSLFYLSDQYRYGKPIYERTWVAFRALSTGTKRQLPVWVYKRILRQILPTPKHIKAFANEREKRTDLKDEELPHVTAFPWEPRLQYVVSHMKDAQAYQRELKADSGKLSGPGISLRSETVQMLDEHDYHFILHSFALTGYLEGTERVFKEMAAAGLHISAKTYDYRLATLTKWLTTRQRVYERFLQASFQQMRPHTYGFGRKAAAQLPPFFPPAIAALLNEMLDSMNEADAIQHRHYTLQRLLRVAKATKNEAALNLILGAGYGFNLKYPDADPGSMGMLVTKMIDREQRDQEWPETGSDVDGSIQPKSMARVLTPAGLFSRMKRDIDTHGLNTVVSKYGEEGKLWEMVQAFEVLSQPISGSALPPLMDVPIKIRGKEAEESTGEADGADETGQVESEAEQEEEPPVTLTEAMRREEMSGQRLDFFGRQIPAPEPEDDVSSKVPSFEIRPASSFLPPMPSPFDIISHIESTFTGPPNDNPYKILYSDRAYIPNTTTYRTMIKSAAVEAGTAETTLERDNAIQLGLYLLRTGVSETMARHNAFLDSWRRITVYTKALRDNVLAAGEPVGPNQTEKDSPRQRLSRERGEVELTKADQLRSALRARTEPPRIAIDAHTVLPLLQALRSVRSTRGDGSTHWRTSTREVIREIERMAAYYREELAVLVNRASPRERENAVGRETMPEAAAASELSTLR